MSFDRDSTAEGQGIRPTMRLLSRRVLRNNQTAGEPRLATANNLRAIHSESGERAVSFFKGSPP
jgi:hypothetical protein